MSLIKSVNFSTLLSNNSSTSNPFFYLQSPIVLADSYCVSNCIGVNTTYNIDSRNNTLSFLESISPGTNRTAILLVGNYTITSFLTELSTALTAAGTQAYTLTAPTLTDLITITAPTRTFKITNSLTGTDCLYESGLSVSSVYALSQTGLVSYDLSGLKIINIVCSSLGTGNTVTVNKNANIILSIPIYAAYLSPTYYNPPLNFISSQIAEINSFEFYLMDERYRTLTITKDRTLTILFKNDN